MITIMQLTNLINITDENIETFKDRLKRACNFKKIKDDKKAILSSELNGLFHKYCRGRSRKTTRTEMENEVSNDSNFNFIGTSGGGFKSVKERREIN